MLYHGAQAPRGHEDRRHVIKTETPAEYYTSETATWQSEHQKLAGRSDALSNARLGLFLLALLLAAGALWQQMLLLWLGAGLSLVGFMVAVFRHDTVEKARRHAEARALVQEEGLLRLQRDWSKLPLRAAPRAEPPPAVAGDLDILGHASLQHLLNTTYTTVGQQRLEEWLLEAAPAATIKARQAAVREMAGHKDLRTDLAAAARLLGAEQENYATFLTWAEGERQILGRFVQTWAPRLLALVTLGLIVADVLNILPPHGWIISLIINQLWTVAFGGPGLKIIAHVAARQSSFRAYAALFGIINGAELQAPLLRERQAALRTGSGRAEEQMRRLARIANIADMRLSLLFPLIQVTTLWSFHVAWFLERWQRDAGSHARPWLMALADFEALGALGTLAFDHPDWAFPTIDEEATTIAATAIGHPLIAPSVVKRNDITVGPAGSFVLITGSNMSGKSTLLRSVGLGCVLAQAGGPACATSLTLPPVELATSVRIQDSLERGVSYYMAELERLKEVVVHAESSAGKRQVVFLLDEILHGTNTTERQVAARRIIRHLLKQGAIGIVSTHDLGLAAAPDITAASQPFYFTEEFSRGPQGPTMHFDYVLRPGLATSTNALKLMEIVGLPTEDS